MFLAHFRSIFPIFGAKKCCLKNPALSSTNSSEFLASCQNLEKTNNTVPRKHPDRRKHGQTLFHRILLANSRDPKKILSLAKTEGALSNPVKYYRLFEERLCTRPLFPDFLILVLVIRQLCNAWLFLSFFQLAVKSSRNKIKTINLAENNRNTAYSVRSVNTSNKFK